MKTVLLFTFIFATSAFAQSTPLIEFSRNSAAQVYANGEWQWEMVSGNSENLAKFVVSIPTDELTYQGASQCVAYDVAKEYSKELQRVYTASGKTKFLGKKLKLQKFVFDSTRPTKAVTHAQMEGGKTFLIWQETRPGYFHRRENHQLLCEEGKSVPILVNGKPLRVETEEECLASIQSLDLFRSALQGPSQRLTTVRTNMGDPQDVPRPEAKGLFENVGRIFESTPPRKVTYTCSYRLETCEIHAADTKIAIFGEECETGPAMEYNKYCYKGGKAVYELGGEIFGSSQYLALFRGDSIVSQLRTAEADKETQEQYLERYSLAWITHHAIMGGDQNTADDKKLRGLRQYLIGAWTDSEIAYFHDQTGAETKPFDDYRAKAKVVTDLLVQSLEEAAVTTKLSEDLLKLNAINDCCNDEACRNFVNASGSARHL